VSEEWPPSPATGPGRGFSRWVEGKMIESMIQVVAYLPASAVIAGAVDLAFLVLEHVLVVATGDDGVATFLVVVVGFAHNRLLPAS